MSSVSFGNLNTASANMSPELEKRVQSQENFGAIDSEKLKQDAVEISKKAIDNTKENVLIRGLKHIGIKDPKKFFKTLGWTVVTAVGVAVAGNKLTSPAAKLADSIDKVLTSDGNILGKTRNFLVNNGSNLLKNISKKRPKLKVEDAIKDAFDKHTPGPDWKIFRGFENGAKGVFSNTVMEEFTKILDQNEGEKLKNALASVLGGVDNEEAKKAAQGFINKLKQKDITNVKFCDELVDAIQKANSGETLNQVFEKMKKGEHGKILTNITMDQGGITGAWWPVNYINKIYKSFTGKELQGAFKGNVGDSLMKYAAIRGKSAKTLPAKLVQIIPPLVGDQVSNFVNDKSGFGVFLLVSLYGQIGALLDTPKEKRVTNALNDVASGSIGWMVSMPLIFAAIYNTANLRFVEGKGITNRLLKTVGKVAGFGLGSQPKFANWLLRQNSNFAQLLGRKLKPLNGIKGTIGGVARFFIALQILSPFVSKQIGKVCAKIFGKPYDKAEEDKKKQLEAQKNQVIPELGITQGELMEKMEKNPQALVRLQSDAKLAQTIAQNPKALLDLLDGKEVEYIEPKPTPASQGVVLSQANQKILNKETKTDNTTNAIKTDNSSQKADFSKTPEEKAQKEAQEETQEIENKEDESSKSVDVATYIPSSDFVATKSSMSQEQLSEYNAIMERADKALKAAEKYI